MIRQARAALLSSGLAILFSVTPGFSQTQTAEPPRNPAQPGSESQKSAAYYNFAMGHLYAELAGAYGNRGEYVNKAIDFYKEAMKLDSSSTYVAEELTELYIQAGQLQKAVLEAEDLLKQNPDNLNAHRILGRVYSRMIGDPQQGKIDQTMLRRAIEQYQKIAEKDPKDSESLSILARLYRVSHDEASAEKTYRTILEQDPNNDDALSGLAMVYADKGDLKNAIAMLKQAAEKDPNPRTLVALAEFYEQNHDYANAADTWKQALPLTNDNERVRRAYAQDLLSAGRLDEALQAYQDLATDQPKDAQLQLRIAEIWRQKRNLPNARAALAKAREIDNGPEVKYEEVNLLDAEGKTAQAVAMLQSMLNETKKAQYTDAERGARMMFLERLGQLERSAGKTQEAVAALRQVAELDPSLAPRVEAEIIETMRIGKDYKAARAEAEAAIHKYPKDRTLTMVHASLLADLGQTDAAVNELKALPDSSKDREVLLAIAQVYEKAKRYEDERKTLDSAEATGVTDQDRQQISFLRGAMYERLKDFDAAEREFRKVLDMDPNNAGAMNYLGYMFADQGVRLDEAHKLISKALDLDPDNGAYLDSLGWVYFRRNQLDEAADQLRRALDKVGKDPTVHDHLGDVYFKQGKIREAIQQWEASVSEWKAAAPSDQDPVELAKVAKKLESAKVRIAKETHQR